MVVQCSTENLLNAKVLAEGAANDNNAISDSEQELLEIMYHDRYPTLVFFTPLALKCVQRKTSEIVKRRYTSIGEKYNMSFKMIKSDSKLVKTVLFSYGFLQCSSKNQNCNLFWTNTHVGPHVLRSLRPWQRINHFPRSFMITKKDVLYESIDRALVQYGNCFDFIPDYFCTPMAESKREKLVAMCREIEENRAAPFIVKPACSSRGRDITFLESVEDLKKLDSHAKLLISRYIDRPLLINKLKSDLRVYVLVTSFYPLIVYIYSDGLARFAVHEYDDKNRRNFSDANTHLTNYSLNKTSAHFIKNSDCSSENVGHKWTLGAFLREIEKLGYDSNLLMVRIEDIVIKTLLSIQGSVAASCRKFNLHPKCCFELFGFDILVDEDLKPWLLEVNLSPSLACDAPLDSILKTHLICDTLNIASIPLVRERNVQNHCASLENTENEVATNEGNNEVQQQTINEPTLNTTNIHSLVDSSIAASPSSSCTVLAGGDCEVACFNGTENVPKRRPNSVNENYFLDNKVNEMQNLTHSASCEAFSTTSNKSTLSTRKRKLMNTRASKVRRAQLSYKPSFSANLMTVQYIARSKCHFDKLELEDQRKGRFIRAFPRFYTWQLYGLILEDAGQEKWDRDLHRQMNEGVELPELTVRSVECAHEQLLDAKNYPSQDKLDPIVRDVILKQALNEANKYKMKMYSADIKPYPAALPFVRMNARRRTKSQMASEEVRRNYLLGLKAQQQARQALPSQLNKMPSASANKNNEKTADLETLKVDELTANVTIVLENSTATNSDNNYCNKGLDEVSTETAALKNCGQGHYKEQSLGVVGTALTEVNLNFIVKKGKDGAIVLEDSRNGKNEV